MAKRVTVLMALMAGSVSAKQSGKNRATYNFKGVVQEVDGDGSYLVVDVTGGNKRARAHLGPQNEVKVRSKAAKDATVFDARKFSVEQEGDEDEEEAPAAP